MWIKMCNRVLKVELKAPANPHSWKNLENWIRLLFFLHWEMNKSAGPGGERLLLLGNHCRQVPRQSRPRPLPTALPAWLGQRSPQVQAEGCSGPRELRNIRQCSHCVKSGSNDKCSRGGMGRANGPLSLELGPAQLSCTRTQQRPGESWVTTFPWATPKLLSCSQKTKLASRTLSKLKL